MKRQAKTIQVQKRYKQSIIESYPETDAQLIFSPPDYEIPPYADVQTCWYTTYTGEDVVIIGGSFRQSEQFGHHVILMRTRADEDDVPDGTIEDCSETGDMTDSDPFVLPSNPGKSWINPFGITRRNGQ